MSESAFWEDHLRDMEDPEYAEAYRAARREALDEMGRIDDELNIDEDRLEALFCAGCGKPEGSFACRVRHINVDTSWARKDH